MEFITCASGQYSQNRLQFISRRQSPCCVTVCFFLGNKDIRLQPKATNMASNTPRSFHLFNCDNLCKLSEVEALLKAVKGKVPFKILQLKRHEFRRKQIEEIVFLTVPNLKTVDYAVFVVHAAEACLSFSDDSGYGKIYEALKKRTGWGRTEADTTGKKHFLIVPTPLKCLIHICMKFPALLISLTQNIRGFIVKKIPKFVFKNEINDDQ